MDDEGGGDDDDDDARSNSRKRETCFLKAGWIAVLLRIQSFSRLIESLKLATVASHRIDLAI